MDFDNDLGSNNNKGLFGAFGVMAVLAFVLQFAFYGGLIWLVFYLLSTYQVI